MPEKGFQHFQIPLSVFKILTCWTWFSIHIYTAWKAKPMDILNSTGLWNKPNIHQSELFHTSVSLLHLVGFLPI